MTTTALNPDVITTGKLEIKVTRIPRTRVLPPAKELGFGRIFTDHMFAMDYEEGRGWYDARIIPYGPLALDPGASALHYGQAMFDGLKGPQPRRRCCTSCSDCPRESTAAVMRQRSRR